MREKVILADKEGGYLEAITAKLWENTERVVDVVCFTRQNMLKTFIQTNDYSLLIVSEEMAEELPIDDRMVILTQEPSNYKQAIKKFQPLSKISDEIFQLLQSMRACDRQDKNSTNKVISIYSPIGQSGKTHLAISLANQLGLRGNTLLINLERYPTLDELIGITPKTAFGEGLFLAKTMQTSFVSKMLSEVQQIGRFDCLPPLVNTSDLSCVDKETWDLIFEKLKEEAGYRYIVVDVDGIEGILSISNSIIAPTAVSRTAYNKYSKWLQEKSTPVITVVNKHNYIGEVPLVCDKQIIVESYELMEGKCEAIDRIIEGIK